MESPKPANPDIPGVAIDAERLLAPVPGNALAAIGGDLAILRQSSRAKQNHGQQSQKRLCDIYPL